MFAVVWISFVGLVNAVSNYVAMMTNPEFPQESVNRVKAGSGVFQGGGLGQQTRYERTRYVSGRNQIFGGNFDFNEKYIPFVHYWERPLQVLESSMKIPKKLSSRPLFSWDIPVQISTYTPSRKVPATEPVAETTPPPKEREPPNAHTSPAPGPPKTVQKSRSDRARASAIYSYPLIPTKKKKSGNRKKSIQETERWRELEDQTRPPVRVEKKLKKKKKVKKNRKGKSEKRRKLPTGEMNDQMNEVNAKGGHPQGKKAILEEGTARPEAAAAGTGCEEKECEHRCETVKGAGVCVCFRGFALVGERCVDVNECERNNGDCNGRCVNTIGSRKCLCSPGFRLVDGSCADVNECLLRNGHGPCQDRCTNTLGGYYCSCDGLPGTALSPDNHTCENARTCNPTAAGCSHSCVGVSGATFCTCPDGMELGDDWKTCHDIDECSNPEDYDVRCEWGCVNTIGSYACAGEDSTRATAGDDSSGPGTNPNIRGQFGKTKD